jgi:hypothetical protein
MTTAVTSVSIVFLAGSVLLIVAGVGHSRHHDDFLATLSSHGLLPRRLVRLSSWCVVGAELTVGSWGAFAVVNWQLGGGLSVGATLAEAGLYLLLSGYLVALIRLRPGADCGCFHPGAPVNVLTVVRASGLAGVALAFPMLVSAETASMQITGSQMAASWLCSAVLVAALSVAPHALVSVPAHQLKGW